MNGLGFCKKMINFAADYIKIYKKRHLKSLKIASYNGFIEKRG